MNVFNQPSRAARKQATTRAVLEAARAEFERVGYEAANIRGIAKRAGVSAATVIHYHADKRVLLHAALFDDLERALDDALAHLGRGTFENRLSKLTRGVFRYYEQRPKLSRTLLKESLFADEPWAGRFTAQVARIHAEIARLAADAITRGELRAGTDVARLAAAYFAFFYFALIAWVQGATTTPVAFVDHLLAQHLEGSRPRKSP